MAHRENWNSQMAWAPSHSKKRQNQAGPDSVTIRVAKAVQALKVQEKYYKSFFNFNETIKSKARLPLLLSILRLVLSNI